jgi:hypothetical protein
MLWGLGTYIFKVPCLIIAIFTGLQGIWIYMGHEKVGD